MSSTKNPGRFAGLLYILTSIPGFFAMMYVPSRVLRPTVFRVRSFSSPFQISSF